MVYFIPSTLKSKKRKKLSRSPPDDTKRDPTYYPRQDYKFCHGRTPPHNAKWKSRAPLDALRRVTAASEISQDNICIVTNEVGYSSSAIQFAHVVPSATSGDENKIRAIECVLGLAPNSFSVHSSRNIQQLGMKIHDLWDDHRVAFIPADKDDVNRLTACFCESPLEERRENNLDQVFPRIRYAYMLICIPPLLPSTFILHRKNIVKEADGIYRETGEETPYHAPFLSLPLIKSHIPPPIMALNAGEKMKALDLDAMDIFNDTYGRDIGDICNQILTFYQHFEFVGKNLPRGFLDDTWSKERTDVHDSEHPAKRPKTGSLGCTDNDDANPESLGPTTLVDTSSPARSVTNTLFSHSTFPLIKPIGSRHIPLEGLVLENFTGQPFDYINPYKAMEIIKELEEQRDKPSLNELFQVPPQNTRLLRIPRLSSQASPASDTGSMYTPSRPAKFIPRNAKGQKIYSLKCMKSLAAGNNQSVESSPTHGFTKGKTSAPVDAGVKPSEMKVVASSARPTSPTKDKLINVPEFPVAAPVVAASSRSQGNTATSVAQSRRSVPSSRIPVPSSKLPKRRIPQANDAPLQNGPR